MDEKELVKKLKQGKSEFFPELISKYKGVVFGHAMSYLRNAQDAEDVTQEIFVNIFNYIKNFRGDSSLSTWIYRITVNTCKNKLKQVSRLRSHIADEPAENPEDGPAESMVSCIREKEEKEPDNVFVSNEVRNTVYRRMGELPEEQRQVITLRDIDGLSYEEIAKITKQSVQAVKSKLFRARENLRAKLKNDGIF